MIENFDSKFYKTLIIFIILVLISVKLTYLPSTNFIRNPIMIIIILLCLIYITKFNLLLSIGMFLLYICLYNGLSNNNLSFSEHFSNENEEEDSGSNSDDNDSKNDEEESNKSDNESQEEIDNQEETNSQEEESNSQSGEEE